MTRAISILKVLLPFMIGAVLMYFFIPKKDKEYQQVVSQKDKYYESRIDSMHKQIQILRYHDLLWSKHYVILRDSVELERRRAKYFKNEYYKAKTQVIHFTDPSRDSLVRLLTN